MITREEFENIALLSRLSTAECEYDRFAEDLSRMVQFADRIREVYFEETDFTAKETDVMSLREDVVEPSRERAEILSNAPCSQDGFFLLRKRA